MQLQRSLWWGSLKYSNNHKLQVNVLNANRKLAGHIKKKLNARFSQRFNTFDFCTETCRYWWLPVNLPFLGFASDGAGRKTPLGLGLPACRGWSWSGTRHTPASGFWAPGKASAGHLRMGDRPRRPAMLGLSHNTPALHPAHSPNHSADAHPMSAVIHLILIYRCNIHPQCWLFSWFFQVWIYRQPLLLRCFSKTKAYGMIKFSCT